MVKRALISVSDKRGIIEFAKNLSKMGVEIISTGGTYKKLKGNGIEALEISDITNFPESLGGRVKTLHPMVHGGILADRDNTKHMEELKKLNIKTIDIVVVNLYPFKDTILKKEVQLEEAIENIDIGGPTMIRSAAKNYKDVTVIVDPKDYTKVINEIKENGNTSYNLRYNLALKVFRHTSQYDTLISQYLSNRLKEKDDFPDSITLTYEKVQDLRYGENPHQKAAFYKEIDNSKGSLINSEQIHGKELSFNNINDTNGAIETLKEFKKPTIVAVKHTNPCGVGQGYDIYDAYKKAYEADPKSIFGGIIASNRTIDYRTAKEINNIFVEIVIAPDFDKDALDILTQKKNIRLLKLKDILNKQQEMDIKKVLGGILIQTKDDKLYDKELEVVTKRLPTEREMDDLKFAWKVSKHIKSNGIVIAKDKQTIGIGPGQVNRIWALENSIKQSNFNIKGSVMASDAFFPFSDSVEQAAKAGITAIIQPGGSIRDKESIDMANRYGIAMVFTQMRHFKH
mgnify:CR=1 FL=1